MPPQERDHPRPSRAAVQTRIRRDLLPGIFVKEITPNFSFARDDADNESGALAVFVRREQQVKYSSEKETMLAACLFVSKETQP